MKYIKSYNQILESIRDHMKPKSKDDIQAVYFNMLKKRISYYVKELSIDTNNRILKFIPKDDEDITLEHIRKGIWEIGYNIKKYSRDGQYYKWTY